MAFDLGGFLGGVAVQGLSALGLGGNGDETPTSTPSGVTQQVVTAGLPSGGRTDFTDLVQASQNRELKPGAIPILRLLGLGASDGQVRQAARQARVSKTDLFNALTTIEALGGTGLSRLERIAISDQIEKIFRPRPRPVISKTMKRTAKQMEFFMKLGRKFAPKGHAHFTTTTKGHK